MIAAELRKQPLDLAGCRRAILDFMQADERVQAAELAELRALAGSYAGPAAIGEYIAATLAWLEQFARLSPAAKQAARRVRQRDWR